MTATMTEARSTAYVQTATSGLTIKKQTVDKSLALSVSNLNVRLSHKPYTAILKDVSFDLKKGEVAVEIKSNERNKPC
ncbi:hypothetical protein [Endozoicomonas sp. YOMI1]|uniref:hypothetical protein n=1 Tax=Endozoicomonas sp. YOMI1 TaxID=2828739 RepID=UPI002147DAD7|nr:hypothetical protein [Endozoicomonas sp. YOMI1]